MSEHFVSTGTILFLTFFAIIGMLASMLFIGALCVSTIQYAANSAVERAVQKAGITTDHDSNNVPSVEQSSPKINGFKPQGEDAP